MGLVNAQVILKNPRREPRKSQHRIIYREVSGAGKEQSVKAICMRFLPVLLVVLAVETSWAFEPGPIIIRECPKCKAYLEQPTTMSGNTFGARFWTDGKMVAPMLPDRPWLVKCPRCGSLFWIDEANEIRRQNPWDKGKEWLIAAEPVLPSRSEVLALLADGNLPEKKEFYARRLAWWMANDTVRENVSAAVNLLPEDEKNLRAFVALLDEKAPDQRIMKAEGLRELGEFQDCIRLLEQPFEKAHHARLAAFIRELALHKNRTVREIKGEE